MQLCLWSCSNHTLYGSYYTEDSHNDRDTLVRLFALIQNVQHSTFKTLWHKNPTLQHLLCIPKTLLWGYKGAISSTSSIPLFAHYTTSCVPKCINTQRVPRYFRSLWHNKGVGFLVWSNGVMQVCVHWLQRHLIGCISKHRDESAASGRLRMRVGAILVRHIRRVF